jgi:hypothetical protein
MDESVVIVVESVEVVVSVLLLQEVINPADRMAKKAREFLFIMLILVRQHIKNLCQRKLLCLRNNIGVDEIVAISSFP